MENSGLVGARARGKTCVTQCVKGLRRGAVASLLVIIRSRTYTRGKEKATYKHAMEMDKKNDKLIDSLSQKRGGQEQAPIYLSRAAPNNRALQSTTVLRNCIYVLYRVTSPPPFDPYPNYSK